MLGQSTLYTHSIILSVINQTPKMDQEILLDYGFTKTLGSYDVMIMTAMTPYGCDFYPKPLMDMILELADLEDGDFEKIKSPLEKYLNLEVCGTAEHATVNIFDEPFFPRPKGHMRKIKISFFKRVKRQTSKLNDLYITTVEFSLARRNAIKTLKDLALDAVISNVTSHLMINKMEIPETLKMTLRKEFYNEFSRKRFPSYNITLLPFAESLKAGGLDVKTIDEIMDDYMFRIELTRRKLATGSPDPSALKDFVWKQFFQAIARLRSPGLMDHLNQTLHELGVERRWAEHAEIISVIQQVAAVEDMEQDQPLDLSLNPPRFWC